MSPFFAEGFQFPEAPRWRNGHLYISDQHGHRVIAVFEDGSQEVIVELKDMPSGLGWLPDGAMLIASMRDQRILRFDDGRLTVHCDLSGLGEGWLNDMVVDGRGNAYVGHRNGAYATPTKVVADRIVLVRADGTHCIVDDEVVSPNGSVVTPDGQTLIVAESRPRLLTAWTIGRDGELSDRRTFARLETEVPDGICLDAEGGVWVAGLGRTFSRVVEGGRITTSIEVFGGKAVACALGGTDRRTLYMIVSIFDPFDMRTLRTAGDDVRSTSIGWLEAAKVSIPGAGWP